MNHTLLVPPGINPDQYAVDMWLGKYPDTVVLPNFKLCVKVDHDWICDKDNMNRLIMNGNFNCITSTGYAYRKYGFSGFFSAISRFKNLIRKKVSKIQFQNKPADYESNFFSEWKIRKNYEGMDRIYRREMNMIYVKPITSVCVLSGRDELAPMVDVLEVLSRKYEITKNEDDYVPSAEMETWFRDCGYSGSITMLGRQLTSLTGFTAKAKRVHRVVIKIKCGIRLLPEINEN